MNDARQCWQEGWTKAQADAHNSEYHKVQQWEATQCNGAAAHTAHYVVEASGITYTYLCSAGHETQDTVI